MEGPSSKAVSKAISLLLESVNANNGIKLHTSFHQLPEHSYTHANQYIRALKLIRQSLLRHLDDRTAHQHRNTSVAVGKPPTELLADIFQRFLLSERDAKEMEQLAQLWPDSMMSAWLKRLHRLASVCTRWGHIIKSTPHFWANVHAEKGSLITLQLQRSSNLPLSINFRPRPYLSGADFMDLIVERRHRWRSLDLWAKQLDWEEFRPFLVEPMALLEEATLAGDEDEVNIGYESPIPFGGGPRLRSLHLICLHLDTSTTTHAFGSLVELCISELTVERGEPYFWELLSQCRGLKTLRLTRIESSGRWPSVYPIVLVSLPHLETLKVSKIDDVCPRLLLGLHAEKLKWLRVMDDASEGGGLDNLVLPQGYSTPLQSILSNINFHNIRIAYCSIDHMIDIVGAIDKEEASRRVSPYNIPYPHHRPSMTLDLRLLQQTGGLNSLCHITFGTIPILIELYNGVDPGFLQFLPSVISVSLLSIEGRNWEEVQEYTTFLSRMDDITGRCPCPRLTTLFIDYYSPDPECNVAEHRTIVDDFQRMLRIRRTSSDDVPAINMTTLYGKFDDVNGRFIMTEDSLVV